MKEVIYNLLNDPEFYRAELFEVLDQFMIMLKRAKMNPPYRIETEFPLVSKITNTP